MGGNRKNLGKKLTKVGCIDCHGKIGAEKLDHEKELIMPNPALCGECHKQEYNEFESEKQYGIPDWKPGRESHAKSYDANLDVDVWAAVDKNVVQGCDMCHNIQHKCDSCHTRHAFKASESRRPEACQTCHNGPDHPDIEYYRDSKHGSIYFIEGHT
ncbi:MAG: multiheme c-type cytochrome, partial [Planctomycetota bacterium]